jgi:hypothetical protein
MVKAQQRSGWVRIVALSVPFYVLRLAEELYGETKGILNVNKLSESKRRASRQSLYWSPEVDEITLSGIKVPGRANPI